MQPRTNDTPKKRVKALSAALKSMFWDYIEKNFYYVYLEARHRQDMDLAIYLISESQSRVSHSWFEWSKSYFSSPGPLHRLPDLIVLSELHEDLQRQINTIKNLLKEMKSPVAALDENKFDKIKRELISAFPYLLGAISEIQSKLALKVKFSFNDERYYCDADDIAPGIIGYDAKKGMFLYVDQVTARIHRDLDRISSYCGKYNKTPIKYLDHGLLGMYGDHKLVRTINDKVLENKFINLPELINSFNGWIEDQLNEIKLPHSIVKHSIFSATAPLKQKINHLSDEVINVHQDLQTKNEALKKLIENRENETKDINSLISAKKELSEQLNELSEKNAKLEQKIKGFANSRRKF